MDWQLGADAWAEGEGRTASREFCDLRLARRFRQILVQLSDTGGPSIPFASQDWAQAKAAYRFFSNPRVDERAILSGHMRRTRERADAAPGPLLILHDTTEISYGGNTDGVGLIGRVARHTVCGILMHSSLAVTLQGLPLGLCAIKFWTRSKFKGTNALKRSINATRVPIEQKESIRWLQNVQQATELLDCPDRCIHVGDREGDIYELFCAATGLHTHFLIRTCADRLCGDGSQTVGQQMAATRTQGLHRVEFRDPHGRICQALLTLAFQRLRLLPSRAKRSRYPELTVTVIHAREKDPPEGREPIDWKLVTDLPVRTRTEAVEKLRWYALRWKIEVFHHILKSGCRIEESRLRTAQRRVNLIAACCIVSWRIFWLTMVCRYAPRAPAAIALTESEKLILCHASARWRKPLTQQSALGDYLVGLARLGGYLARAHDPPPGNLVMWRGMRRLSDLELGAELVRKCG
ncbi:MAG: IS4 family transposase [Castellaniella sp.]|nr:MAG: IS4 family transposase [Castellaniella sp.]